MRRQTAVQLEDRATVLLLDFALGFVRSQTREGLIDLVEVLSSARDRLRLDVVLGAQIEAIARDTAAPAAPAAQPDAEETR